MTATLLPRPKVVRERVGAAVRADAPVQWQAQPAGHGPEAYGVSVGDGRIIARASTDAGRRWALATLAQLRAGASAAGIAPVEIEDWPTFAVRGVMLDVSRDRVPTMNALYAIVRTLASWKINHLQLYTEHTFAYAGHEDVWRGWSAITPDEMRRLDAFSAEHGVELAANQNCFGHLATWLRHERYAHLAEMGASETWRFYEWDRTGPFSLCPIEPGSIALVQDILRQIVPCVRSRLVNIGCDETADVGQGRSRIELERRGGGEAVRAAMYAEFVERVAAAARELGARPMFWSDVAQEHPEALSRIGSDAIGLVWGYEPSSPFDAWTQAVRSGGREAWVCPGTSSWRSITGRTSERRGNMRAAAEAGERHGARGYLVTDWGDLGHRQQWPIALAGLADGAAYAWGGASAAVDERAVALHAFGDESGEIGGWLAALGDIDEPLRAIGGRPDAGGRATRLKNASAMFVDSTLSLHEPWPNGAAGLSEASLWRAALERLDACASRRPSVRSALINDELSLTVRVARAALERAIARREGASRSAAYTEMARTWEAIEADHRRLWRVRSREGGLEASAGHYRRISDELRRAGG